MRRRWLLQLVRALRLVWHSSRGWTLVSTGLLLVESTLPLASLYLMKLVVDTVAGGLRAPGRGSPLRRWRSSSPWRGPRH